MSRKFEFVASESVDYYMRPVADGIAGHEFTDEEIADYMRCHDEWHRWQMIMHNALSARIEADLAGLLARPPMPPVPDLS